jgi:hypothetical protein
MVFQSHLTNWRFGTRMPPMGEFREFLKVYSHHSPVRAIRVKEFLDLEKTMTGVGLCPHRNDDILL